MAHQRICVVSHVFAVVILAASLASCISGTLLCEDLPVDLCAFAVSSTGSRCVLEKRIMTDGNVEHECQTSEVAADEFSEWVETDECVRSCGLDRMSVGISSDALVERGFEKALCSADCQGGCANVVDLFTKLAAGEGVSLAKLCEVQATASSASSRREMGEVPFFASLSANTGNAWERTAVAPSSSQSLDSHSLWTAPAPAPSSL